jgi:PPOX class probable F420-dependent enzyme
VPALEQLPDWAQQMLAEGRVARLAMLDDEDRPRVLPVTYVLHAGLIYSAVDEKPKRAAGAELARVRFLRRRPEASVLVDRYDERWERLAWVQVLVRAELVDVSSDRAGVDALRAKYEPYRDAAPPGPLLRLVPRRALCWRAEEALSGHPDE